MRFVVAVAVVLACSVAASADNTVRYSLSPVVAQGKLEALAVEIAFTGGSDGETVLQLPNEWGGKKELYQGVRDLQVTGEGVVISEPEPAKRIVKHAPGAALTVSYRIVQYWPGEPAASGDNEYRPIVQPTYFQVLGNAIFIEPVRDGFDENVPATFVLKGLPNGWSFASDLEHGTMGRKLLLGDVIESVAVGGDFRVLRRGLLRVAIRGTWSFTDDKFVDRVNAIVASHLRFWNDPDEPFLVTVLPLKSEPGRSSLGGTGRSDAFAFFATDNAEDVTLNRVLAHEHLHTWIPRRIGSMPDAKNEAADYWLSEGFTDFYTARLLLRDGIWSLEDYVTETNSLLKDYATSSARTAPNSRVVADFWNDPDVGKLPYQRGALLATMWDARLRAVSGGKRDFDDVMFAMKARAAAATGKAPLASTLFREEMKAAGVDAAPDLARYVETGDALLLPADVFGSCGNVATLDVAEFDRGFDPRKTAENGNVITDLREDSPAYRAGLRNGMKIVKREAGKPGDSRVPVTYRVIDNGAERVITYQPEGKKRITLQEFTLRASMTDADRKACIALLAGA